MSLDELARTSTAALLDATAARTDTAAGQVALRRSMRRRRVVSMALAAAGTVAVVVFGSLVLVQPTRQSLQQPAGPPADGSGLTAPLVAPTSLLDVHALGFHVTPPPGFDPSGLGAGWGIDGEGQSVTLRWADVADVVEVHVGYQGAPAPEPSQVPGWYPTAEEQVTIHGAVGHYYDEFGIYGLGDSYRALLTWEYAPDSWAYVSAHSDRMSPGPERLRSALVEVAEAVRAGGEPVRVPIRAGAFPPSLPAASTASGVSMSVGIDGWEPALDFGPHLRFSVGRVEVPRACEGYDGGFVEGIDGGFVETFTYAGKRGCLNGYGTPDRSSTGSLYSNLNAVSLQAGHWVRTVEVFRSPDLEDGYAPEYPIADLKEGLADLTVAPLDDQSTWFDLTTALGGS